MTARLPAPSQLLGPLLTFGLAAVVGLLAGFDPILAVAAAVAIAFFVISVTNLSVGVVAFTTVTFLELAPAVGGPALSFTKIAGLALAVSWIAVITTDTRSDRLIFGQHPVLTALSGLFLAWGLLSVLWAENPASVYDAAFRYVLNIALIPIVYTAIVERRHLIWIATALAGGATISALYGLAAVPSASEAVTSSTAAGELDRVAGTVGDPNLLAATLVVGLVMAVVLALIDDVSPLLRLLAGASAGICLLGIFVTVSRGGIVALLAAGLAAIVFAGSRYRAQIALASVSLLVVGAAWFALFAPEGTVERLTTADGGTGRTDIWKIGWRMFEAQPLHGVGSGNFRDTSVHYLLVEPGAIERDEFIVDSPSVTHNLYLQFLSELGIVGLALFIGIVIASLAAAVKAARIFQRLGEHGPELISRGVVIATISLLAADFFLSNEFDKRFWLLIALGPALMHIARTSQSRAGDAGSV